MNVSIKKILSLLLVVAMAFTAVDTSGLFKLTENVYAGDQNAPVNLTFSKSGNSKTITWNGVNGATGYNIYRSKSRYGTYSKINNSTITYTSYTDSTYGSYYYKVRTQFNGWESGDSDPISEDIQLFGNNVYVFDTNDNASDVQSVLTNIWNKQEQNQFGSDRYAFFFKPGTYSSSINVKVGFYTQVSGLGTVPTDTTIQSFTCDARWLGGDSNHNATCNFWRMAENLNVNSSTLWAVSQAVSLRRMKINGNLLLHDNGGWASGGFLADSVITGQTQSGSQQQWLSRNCTWGSWNGQNWNMVFVGIKNNNTPNEQWDGKITRVAEAPVVQEKPFLTYTENAGYRVFVPERRTYATGTSWENGANGEYISLDNFYVAKPDVDSADTINTALRSGKHLLFTPGIYKLDKAIEVNNPNTILLGMGLASLQSTNGNECIKISDVDGVKVAGLLFDAGNKDSATLLKVGETASSKSHASNPIVLSDVFFRVGGFLQSNTNSDSCVVINSNDVIGDNFWVWRADHGNYVGWNSNKTKNGIIVNGDNVTIYALMVEHFHEYQTLWNGNGGRTYFYQSEMPYDVPNQSSWMSHNNSVNGYASYKVADDVTSHEAYGLGMYLYNRDATVTQNTVMEIPDVTGVKVHNVCSVMLTGNPGVDHVINNTGSGCYAAGTRQFIIDYGTGVGAPTIVPGNECYNEAQNVTLTSTTKDAVIKYTTDGSTPSRNNGITYSGPFKVNSDVTIKAMAYKDGMTDSVVNTKSLTFGDIAVGKPVTASSTFSSSTEAYKNEFTPEKIVDGNKKQDSSRWESQWSDNQWIMVDLEKNYNLSQVKLTWEAAAAKNYTVEVSTDKNTWNTIKTVTDGAQGAVLDVKTSNTVARYIRVNATQRATAYGYSLYELEAYGILASGEPETEAPTTKPTEKPTEETTTVDDKYSHNGKICVGYLPNWSYSAYQTVDYDALTHICLAFCNPDANGNLSYGISDSATNAIVNKAHSNGVKVMASLGGAGYGTYYDTLTASDKVEAFCDKIISFAKKYNLDGIDIDVEGDAPSGVWPNYENWIRVLKQKCSANNLLLTTAVGQWYANNITNTTFTYFDYVMLMEYDLKANNYNTRISYFQNTKGIPANKIVLGIPFYGSGDAAYKDILAKYPDAWASDSIGGYTYNGVASTGALATLGKSYAGIMIWELSQDATGKHTLLGAVRDKLYDGKIAYRGGEVIGNVITVPGTFDMSKYSDRSSNIQDLTEGDVNYFGYLETNSYIEYTLDVKEAGTYNLSMNIAQESADRTFDVYVDDVKVSTINVTSSGSWTVFNPYSTQIKFDTTGKKKLKLVASGSMNPSGINLTKIAQQETTVDNKKCDLIVTGINTDKTYYAGEEVQFVATIKNIGEAASPANVKHGMSISVDGVAVNWCDQYMGPLQPGEETQLVMNWGPNSKSTWTATEGTHTLSAMIDDTFDIEEANEDNNTYSTQMVFAKKASSSDVTVEINGYQISTTLGGFRTVYSIYSPDNNIEEVGLVYGLGNYASTADMVVNSSSKYVSNYKGTAIGRMDNYTYGSNPDATSYAMTMTFGNVTTSFFSDKMMVRAYAKLDDGTVKYSDVRNITIYDVADALYQNRKMANKASHEYLYNNILTKVNPSYNEVDYDWGSTIIKPQ